MDIVDTMGLFCSSTPCFFSFHTLRWIKDVGWVSMGWASMGWVSMGWASMGWVKFFSWLFFLLSFRFISGSFVVFCCQSLDGASLLRGNRQNKRSEPRLVARKLYWLQKTEEKIKIRGHVSESAYSHVIRWLIDWLGKRCLYFFSFSCRKPS